MSETNPLDSNLEAVQQLRAASQQIKQQLAKVIVGQEAVIEQVLIALFSRGHCLVVGVPGLAKTLLIRTLAESLSLDFRRIQFTPDLMPTDITGTEVIQEDRTTGSRTFSFLPGPVFGNVILADEINRTPPKTQAALLEAMQERQVTVGGTKHPVPNPFFVLATQNPIEQEGTYPLPEAQLDRFMFNVKMDYPSEREELQIVRQTTSDQSCDIEPTLNAQQILSLSRIVRRVPVAEHIALYAIRLVRLTRPDRADAPDFVRQNVLWGAGPRASQFVVLAAKTRAILHGRHHVGHEDVRAVAHPVLRHRLRLTFNADADGVTSDELVDRLIESLPRLDERKDAAALAKVFRSADAR